MLIDLLATDKTGSYNVDLAHILGLHSAIYITELININKKAIKKQKLIDGDYFVIDRDYIKSRTTLSNTEQREIEDSLCNISVLERGFQKDSCRVNIDALVSLFECNKSDIQHISKIAKVKAPTKAEKIRDNLKVNIYATNQELRDAYEAWIDSVYSRCGWMAKEAIIVGQEVVDKYAKGDLDVALKIISIATVNGYRDMNWAVSGFDKNYRVEFYEQRNKYVHNDLFSSPTVSKAEVF